MSIVDDPGFQRLMKMGRPHYCIPSSRTVTRNVHAVFKQVKDRISKMLQVSLHVPDLLDNKLTIL